MLTCQMCNAPFEGAEGEKFCDGCRPIAAARYMNALGHLAERGVPSMPTSSAPFAQQRGTPMERGKPWPE